MILIIGLYYFIHIAFDSRDILDHMIFGFWHMILV